MARYSCSVKNKRTIWWEKVRRESEIFAVGARIDGRREPIRATDDENQAARATAVLTIEESGELYGAKLSPTFVEQPNGITVFHRTQEQFALAFFLLFERERFRILQFGNHFELKRHIVFNPAGVIVDEGRKMLVDGATDDQKEQFHREKRVFSMSK